MACSIGAAANWQMTVRPVFLRVIRPASDSTSRCFMMAGRDMGNGWASSLTETFSRTSSCAMRARRVGSASAAKVRSRAVSRYLTIWLSIRRLHRACQSSGCMPSLHGPHRMTNPKIALLMTARQGFPISGWLLDCVPEKSSMRILIAASALVFAASTTVYAGAVTEEQVMGVQKTIKGMECTVEDNGIEAEGAGYEADDVVCKEGQYE